ncbi:MAG TPA: hypothetical protein VGB79_05605 [Allosphingosinicella sp.]|jgi:hypothetical protein
MTTSDIETADRLSRRRARMLPVLAIIFLTQQATYFVSRVEDGTRSVDHVKIAAWLVLTIVMLLMLTTGGFWFKSRNVRALMDDEVTVANRTAGMRIGFLAAMLGAIALYFVTFFEPVSGREAIHMITTIGIGAALLRFGFLERRAHRDG